MLNITEKRRSFTTEIKNSSISIMLNLRDHKKIPLWEVSSTHNSISTFGYATVPMAKEIECVVVFWY